MSTRILDNTRMTLIDAGGTDDDAASRARWHGRLAVSVDCPVCGAHEGHSCHQKDPPPGCSDSTGGVGDSMWTCATHPKRMQAARKKKFSNDKGASHV